MSWVNIQYESNLRKNDKRAGMKALAVYCLIMCSAFFMDNYTIVFMHRREPIIKDCFWRIWLINYKQMDICT